MKESVCGGGRWRGGDLLTWLVLFGMLEWRADQLQMD